MIQVTSGPKSRVSRSSISPAEAARGTRQVFASGAQLEEVLALLDNRCLLTRDVRIAERRLRQGTKLVGVDEKFCRPAWRYWARRRWTSEVRDYIQASIDTDTCVLLAFEVDRPKLPWCIVVRCPCCIVLFTLLGAFALIGAGLSSAEALPTLVTDMSSFMEADGEAALQSKAFAQAKEDRAAGGRRLAGLRRVIHLTYVPAEGQNLLTYAGLQEIRRVEEKIRNLPGMKSLCEVCDLEYRRWCERGFSLANFVWPYFEAQGEHTYGFRFDGTGSRTLPLHLATDWAYDSGITESVLPKETTDPSKLIMDMASCGDRSEAGDCEGLREAGQCAVFAEHEAYMRDYCARTCGYCDGAVDTSGKAMVQALRSYFVVVAPCCSQLWNVMLSEVAAAIEGREEMPEEGWKNEDGQGDIPRHRILFGGTYVDGWEALQAIASDMQMAGAAIGFVVFYATVHTRSPLLAVIGLFFVLLSIPMALAIYCLLTQSLELSMLICLSIFIVIGVGSDMIFVYTDFWKQSIDKSSCEAERIRHTYMQAASSTAATTFTTTMSFYANLSSALKPLREFGFIMGTCITMAWLIVLLAYPPVLVMVERFTERVMACLWRFHARMVAIITVRSEAGRRSSRMTRVSAHGSLVMANMMDPGKAGVAAVHSRFLGSTLASCISFCRITVCIFFACFTLGVLATAATSVELDPNVPQVFRADHNAALIEPFEEMFEPINPLMYSYSISKNQCVDFFQSCSLHSCMTLGRRVGSASTCACTQQGDPISPCNQNEVNLRIIGMRGLSPEQVTQEDVVEMLTAQIPNVTTFQLTGGEASLSFLNTTHWETGQMYLASIVRVPKVTVYSASSEGDLACSMKVLCYCDMPRCEGYAETAGLGELGLRAAGDGEVPVSVPWPGRAMEPSVRRLAPQPPEVAPSPPPPPHPQRGLQTSSSAFVAEPTVALQNQIYVDLVFGIKVTGEIQLIGPERNSQYYEFDPAFTFEDPWVQRTTLEICHNIPETLKITRSICWLGGFAEDWMNRGEDWPLRPEQWDVNREVLSYASFASVWMKDANGISWGGSVADFLWFSDDSKLQAMTFSFNVDMTKYVSSPVAIENMQGWDYFVQTINSNLASKTQAGWKAWHTSSVWVRAEADEVIMNSTVETLMISMCCVFLGVFIFTRSLHLAAIVMMMVLCVIICLVYFMVSIMEWAIGAVEVLCLIIFVGFAVDYCFHIAHKYHSCHITTFEEEEEELGAEEVMEKISSAASATASAISATLSDRENLKGLFSKAKGRQSSSPEAAGRPSMSSGAAGRTSMAPGASGRPSVLSRVSGRPSMFSAGPPGQRLTVVCSDTPATTSTSWPLLAEQMRVRRRHAPAERRQRTRFALERMGSSVVGSALTTIGCATFLLPCQIAIFTKIGAVVCAVSLLALIYSLLALPAVLMLIGPCGHDFSSFLQLVVGLVSSLRPTEADEADEEDEAEFRLHRLSSMSSESFLDRDRQNRVSTVVSLRNHYFVLNMPARGVAQVGSRQRATKAEIVCEG